MLILAMKGEQDYSSVCLNSNTIGLMVIIHRLVHRQEQQQYDIMKKINFICQYFQCYMHEKDDPSDFYKRFNSIRTAMHKSGVKMVWPTTREIARQELYPQVKMADLNQWQHHKVNKHADESFHAAMIIANSNNKRYKATSIRMQYLYTSLYVPDDQQQHND